MKLRRKLLCLALSVLMVLPVCGVLMVSADSYRVDSGDGSGVVYNGTTYNSYTVHTLTFDTDDYAVIPFSAYSGGTYTLNGQFNQAVNWGYEPVGVINGDFFSMANGYLNDYLVMNGEVIIGDTNRHSSFGGMTCIMPDGSFQAVEASQLSFATYFNGVEVPGGISYINRRPNRTAESGWTDALYYYDFTAAADKCPLAGVAVICKKLNGTVLTIGGTMDAQVVSVAEKSNANGITLAKDEFLLYVRSSSPLAATLKALNPGDSVTVNASETLAAAADITTNATSILSNCGTIVKDGVNMVPAAKPYDDNSGGNSKIAHSTTYRAQWTAFGTKADGSWVFITTAGASGSSGMTLGQLGDYMISIGCTDVIRLDGGGSTAMYVSDTGNGSAGYKMSSVRNVPDCLMVVKRTSKALQPSDDVMGALEDLIAQAQDSTDETAKAALEYAQSVLNNEKSISGDYTKAMMRLQEALNNKGALGNMLAVAAGANFSDYSEYALTRLREAYTAASEVFGNPDATAEEVLIATAQLVKWVNAKGAYSTSEATYPQMSTGGNFKLMKFNAKIAEGDITLFTPGQSIAQDDANLKWAGAVLLRKNAHGSYVVEKVVNGAAVGSDTYVPNEMGFTVVPDDCLVLGAHGAVNNTAVRDAAVKGTIFTPHGIDIEKRTIGVGAYFSFEPAVGDGHTFDWKVTKAPTCDEKGSEILTCTICDTTSGSPRVIDELDHVYKDGNCLLCGAFQATNLALGKDYKIGYGTNNATYNANLTDGNASTGLSYQPDEWFGFTGSNTQNNIGTATIDLGDDYSIDYARVHTYFGKTGDGVVTPAAMKVEVSSDGTNYTMLGVEVTYANPDQAPGFTTKWVDFVGEEPVIGRYVKLTVVNQGAFAFINEIEVYGVPVTEDDPGKDDPDVPTITVPVEEVIEVDGELDDTGYDMANWVKKGLFQNASPIPQGVSGKFTSRCDDDTIYVAVEVKTPVAPTVTDAFPSGSAATATQIAGYSQTAATGLRIWFRQNDQVRYAFDIQYLGEEKGWIPTRVIYTADKGVDVTLAQFTENADWVVVYNEGTLTAEIAFKKSDFKITGDYSMFVTYFDNFPELVEAGANTYQSYHITNCAPSNSAGLLAGGFSGDTETVAYEKFDAESTELGTYDKKIPCEHEHTTTKKEDATCTEDGYEDVVCDDCGTTISHTEIPALGHDYKDGVCTRCGDKDPDYVAPTPAGKLGDVDCNGKVEATDYMLLKRHILGTYKLTEEGLALADIDQNGKVEATDYMLLKRAILGTYVIADPNA